MAKKKPKPKSPFQGRWHIVAMSGWDEEYFNEEVQAFIEFGPNQGGSFQFGYVQGETDYLEGLRDGEPCVEWSWEGADGADGTPMSGRGWAKLRGYPVIFPCNSRYLNGAGFTDMSFFNSLSIR
jgi:hypothetical protein